MGKQQRKEVIKNKTPFFKNLKLSLNKEIRKEQTIWYL